MKNLSYKLDALQDLACEYYDERNMLTLIGLLAEHVEEDEISEELIKWMRRTANGTR